MRHGDNEEAVPRIRNTSQGIIPREERGEQPKIATRLDAASVGARGIMMQVADAEEEEGHVEGEKEHEKGDRRFQRADQEDCREDEPALTLRLVEAS